MRLALMIIDMQKEFYFDKTKEQMDRATEYINAVIPMFEKKGLPVVWVQDVDEGDGVVPGSPGFEFIDSLRPGPDAIRIHKTYGNSFNKTDVDRILKENGVDTVVMTGFCAEFCVLSTYRGAKDLDYFPVILKNGIASTETANKEFVENISDTVTYGVLEKLLNDGVAGDKADGKEIELKGFLKLKDVSDGFAGLFMRIDGDSGVLQFDNMQSRQLGGTMDWTQYSVKLPLPADGNKIVLGAVLTGKGQLWIDDLEVLIDGKDIREAKARPPVVYRASLDKEFDNGSKIDKIILSRSKIADLEVLGKVWGFLKYHHPAIATGELNWDYELFRILPKIIAAKDRGERNELLSAWVEALGSFETAEAEKSDPAAIKLSPDLNWINEKALGGKLAQQLNHVRNAKRPEKHYYIGTFPNVGNPEFKNEDPYKTMVYPDAGFRLLGLYRYWNIIQYFFPNRHLTDEKWAAVLPAFVPRFVNAGNAVDYRLAALALIESVEDTHANIWGRDEVMIKYRGLNTGPVELAFIEGKAVVTGYWNQVLAEKSGLKIGDVIEKVNDEKVSAIVKRKLDLTPASNYPTKLRDIARYLFETNEPSLKITYARGGSTKETRLETYPSEKFYEDMRAFYGKIPSFRLVRPDIGFLYPGSLKPGEIGKIIPEIAKTKGLIVDLRSYPSDFIVFSLGNYLVPKPTKFVKFSNPSLSSPGLFLFTKELEVGANIADPYQGKIVILINESTQSQAEYTTMAFRTAPNATVIGSTTAGADGNVSRFFLPGGINTMISGIGVYYPDGRETQRIGIVPDVVVKPTIRGIKEGRDELLDKAIQIIEGK